MHDNRHRHYIAIPAGWRTNFVFRRLDSDVDCGNVVLPGGTDPDRHIKLEVGAVTEQVMVSQTRVARHGSLRSAAILLLKNTRAGQ